MVRSLSLPRELLGGDVTGAARSLLGCLVVSESPALEETVTIRITEVEAYAGSDDPASHAWRGLTPRNAVMAGPAGHAYVYFSYGMHWCLNVTAGVEGQPRAVLIRAGEVVAGSATVSTRRPGVPPRDLARGPGRLSRALGVGERHRGIDLCAADSGLRLALGQTLGESPMRIRSGPRVGVSRAADRPWRFWVDDDPTVSAYRRSPRADPLPDSTREQ